jgi:hypothetical protein
MVHLVGMRESELDDGLYFTISWSDLTGKATACTAATPGDRRSRSQRLTRPSGAARRQTMY